MTEATWKGFLAQPRREKSSRMEFVDVRRETGAAVPVHNDVSIL